MNTPYTDTKVSSNVFERIFSADTHDEELEWHRDRVDRTVHIVECNGWKFQADNNLPVDLKVGDTLHIKANEYHRIIKGEGSLVVEINEYETGNRKQ